MKIYEKTETYIHFILMKSAKEIRLFPLLLKIVLSYSTMSIFNIYLFILKDFISIIPVISQLLL